MGDAVDEGEPDYVVDHNPDDLLNPGASMKKNTGRFMHDLVVNEEVWAKWVGKMPCVLDRVEK